ncbi:Lrp/AsnC family transcriptional regulator [Sphingomonas sp. G-3-2-10]|uniref:Lrp/AsnC family transcriptional regulator n=1 Tax=Sphingomonas sp. G-3-2-10 TaxID=2728838 RepID=UPI00146A6398|nr:Lrp/AsnC family transcriptional regulator [Sphingomonas sp. G-3-2-10]NML07669.1 Lrp/AsnC family transcriptional regulator [Sphingomonas sp. G-3-2-10]
MSATRDKMDLRILERLQVNALLTADELAAELPLSASAIARRIRKLRETGVIAGDVAVLSDSVGPFLSAFIHIQLDRHALAAVEALRRRLTASPHVQLYMEISGAFDLVLLVTVTGMEAFNEFADAQLAGDPVVRRYETSFVKRKRKFSLALPLETDSE